MNKDRRNILIYNVPHTEIAMAICFSDDKEAEAVYNRLVKSPFYKNIEWFGREYDSYELEVSSEDC